MDANIVKKILWVSVFLPLLLGCSDPKSEFQPAETLSCQAPETAESLWEQHTLASSLVVSTVDRNFKAGMIRIVDLAEGKTLERQALGSGDSFVRADAERVYVINRLRQDSVRILERRELQLIQEKHDEDLSNPSDVVVTGGKLYLSRYEKKTLRRYSLPDLRLEKEYDLSPFADGDGIPEAQWMILKDNEIYIQLQRLTRDPNSILMLPKDSGKVAVLDTKTDALRAEAIDLEGKNPITEFKVSPDNELYLGSMGEFAKLDGGIERVGAGNFLLTEEQLGGDIVDFAWTGEKELVVIVRTLPDEDGNPKTQVRRVNLEERVAVQTLMEKNGDIYEGFQSVRYVANCDAVMVADRDTENPKIVPISVSTWKPRPGNYYDVGLAPYHVVLAP